MKVKNPEQIYDIHLNNASNLERHFHWLTVSSGRESRLLEPTFSTTNCSSNHQNGDATSDAEVMQDVTEADMEKHEEKVAEAKSAHEHGKVDWIKNVPF